MQGQMMSMGASVAIAFAIVYRQFNKFKGEMRKMNEAFLKKMLRHSAFDLNDTGAD